MRPFSCVPPGELVDLLCVQQELAPADRIELARRERVRGDVHPVQPDLAVLDPGVTVLQVRRAAPDRLHLGAAQHDAALPVLEEE